MAERHYKRGFQTNFKNDNYRVEERLQEYDPSLYIMYNPETDEHLIMDGLLDVAVMKIPQIGFPALTGAIVDHIKRIHTANGFSASWELQEAENRRIREQQQKMDDLADNFARDMFNADDKKYLFKGA